MGKHLILAAALLFFSFLVISNSQTYNLTAADQANTTLMTILNNYYGCRVWEQNSCIQCSVGYYFSAKGICCCVDANCQQFNLQQGICENCYTGYAPSSNGTCIAINLTSIAAQGCANWSQSVCVACSVRYYFDSFKVCQPVNPQCSSWDVNGACTACYYGYVVSANTCILDPNAFKPSPDSLCKTWQNQTCIACADRAYFNSNGICVSVSSQCNAWDKLTGVCLTCFSGYIIQAGACIVSPANANGPTDLGCGTWNWTAQVCLSCSKNWIFNTQHVCVPVSPQCASTDAQGNCLSCYKGYDLTNGQCAYSTSNTAGPTDPGCATWNWATQVCLACSKGWFFSTSGKCAQVSAQCASSNVNGVCLTCYKGYDLINGSCVYSASNTARPVDLGCNTWDWANQVCLKCSVSWIFNANKVCVPVSDQCATASSTGVCLSCFKGYDLTNGACVYSPFNTAAPVDLGCATWDWTNQVCLACSKNWIFNANKVCVQVSTQCATFGPTGVCLSCYKGYDLTNGACVYSPSNTAGPTDLGCATWDWANQVCLACSKNWIFNANKVCIPVSAQCATFGATGACLSCYKGYDLTNGACVYSPSNTAGPTDPGCATWDWANQACLACSKDWIFNANHVCVQVSTQCATFNSAGVCLSCYKGYDLANGTCVYSPSNSAGPTDPGCGLWDWANQVCLACSKNWIFNANHVCVQVSTQCATFNSAGVCLSCYKGYDLINASCVYSQSNTAKPTDVGCGVWDWTNQVCLNCSARWVFNAQKICVPVSDYCSTYDQSGKCLTCYVGYQISNGQCIATNPSCKTLDSNGNCLTCYTGSVLYRSSCVPISKLANIALYYAECCP